MPSVRHPPLLSRRTLQIQTDSQGLDRVSPRPCLLAGYGPTYNCIVYFLLPLRVKICACPHTQILKGLRGFFSTFKRMSCQTCLAPTLGAWVRASAYSVLNQILHRIPYLVSVLCCMLHIAMCHCSAVWDSENYVSCRSRLSLCSVSSSQLQRRR